MKKLISNNKNEIGLDQIDQDHKRRADNLSRLWLLGVRIFSEPIFYIGL